MKKAFFSIAFVFSVYFSFAQKVYFVYLQTEQEKPFFLKMNDKVYSSTASGYLILPKLYDSTYDFKIGFPQSSSTEQKFSVKISGKDHGYLLKDFGDKGWGLFDLQTMAVQMPIVSEAKVPTNTTASNVSSFTDMLSKATDDSTLKQKPVEINKSEEKKAITTNQPQIEEKKEVATISQTKEPVINTDNNKKEDVIQKQEINKDVSTLTPYKKTTVVRKSESSTTKGLGLIYVDDYGDGIKDTIRILISDTKQATNEVKEAPKQDKKFLDIMEDSSKQKIIVPVEKTANTQETETVKKTVQSVQDSSIAKKGCVAVAADSDFYMLRKNMAAETNDDDMVDASKKYFKLKCFSVSQLKNLSTLFLNDAGKYKFFDAAYGHVSDIENFAGLQSELKEEYYINRFKAMLR